MAPSTTRLLTAATAVALVGLVAASFAVWFQMRTLERRVTTLEAQNAALHPPPAVGVPDAGVPHAGLPGADLRDAGSEADLWTCAGAVAPEALRMFLADHGRDVLACGEARARAGTDITGTVVVRVRFDASGRTTHVRFAGALRDGGLEACVLERARAWRTAPLTPADCATIELPFRLGPLPTDAGATLPQPPARR